MKAGVKFMISLAFFAVIVLIFSSIIYGGETLNADSSITSTDSTTTITDTSTTTASGESTRTETYTTTTNDATATTDTKTTADTTSTVTETTNTATTTDTATKTSYIDTTSNITYVDATKNEINYTIVENSTKNSTETDARLTTGSTADATSGGTAITDITIVKDATSLTTDAAKNEEPALNPTEDYSAAFDETKADVVLAVDESKYNIIEIKTQLTPDAVAQNETTAERKEIIEEINIGNILAEESLDANKTVGVDKPVGIIYEENNMILLLPENVADNINETGTISIDFVNQEEDSKITITADVENFSKKRAKIRQLAINAEQRETKIEVDGEEVNIKTDINVNLKRISRNAKLKIRTDNNLDEKTLDEFKDLARNKYLKISEPVGVLTVEKVALKNREDINSAKIRFFVDEKFVRKNKQKDFRVFRKNEETGEVQILDTKIIGIRKGYAVFVAESPDGLSTFANFMVETIESGDIPKPAERNPVRFAPLIVYGVIIVAVGSIIIYSYANRQRK